LKDIKVNKAGTKVQAKAEAALGTVDVTITINCPEPPKTPTITVDIQTGLPFNAGGGETVYEISEADQKAIQDFLKVSNFPPLAFVGDIGGSALAALLDRPTLVDRPALSRFALTMLDIGNTLREDANDWSDSGTNLRYIGFDPGINADVCLDASDGELSLVLTVRMPTRTVTDPQLRFRDAFIHPMRAERARDVDPRVVDDPSRLLDNLPDLIDQAFQGRSLEELADAPVTALRGIGSGAARVLGELGIHRVRDLARWRLVNLAQVLDRLSAPRF
jgi:hypothetical protein